MYTNALHLNQDFLLWQLVSLIFIKAKNGRAPGFCIAIHNTYMMIILGYRYVVIHTCTHTYGYPYLYSGASGSAWNSSSSSSSSSRDGLIGPLPAKCRPKAFDAHTFRERGKTGQKEGQGKQVVISCILRMTLAFSGNCA